jgi:hypothetical protein
MKVKTIWKAAFYGLATISSFYLAYHHWKHGNIDAGIAWLICAGAQIGTVGLYYDIKRYEDKYGDINDDE